MKLDDSEPGDLFLDAVRCFAPRSHHSSSLFKILYQCTEIVSVCLYVPLLVVCSAKEESGGILHSFRFELFRIAAGLSHRVIRIRLVYMNHL